MNRNCYTSVPSLAYDSKSDILTVRFGGSAGLLGDDVDNNCVVFRTVDGIRKAIVFDFGYLGKTQPWKIAEYENLLGIPLNIIH